MHNLIRYYYKNKYKIWAVIVFIVLLLMSIQVLNGIIKITNDRTNLNNNTNSQQSVINNKTTNTFITSDTSGITGENIDNNLLEEASNIIEGFISACNNGNIEEAYNYLSTDCKNEIYTDINKFKILYYDSIFNGKKKKASIENWILNTYKVKITEDIMETGNTNGTNIQDYITIVKEDGESKININNFIKKEEINKNYTIDNIEYIILNKKIYMEYEEYELQVTNKTGSCILLDSQQNTKSIYAQDNNETKYYSYSHELMSSLLKINDGFSTKIEIKFSKSYSLERNINTIVFSDVILNYNDNINDETDNIEIKIAL